MKTEARGFLEKGLFYDRDYGVNSIQPGEAEQRHIALSVEHLKELIDGMKSEKA